MDRFIKVVLDNNNMALLNTRNIIAVEYLDTGGCLVHTVDKCMYKLPFGLSEPIIYCRLE